MRTIESLYKLSDADLRQKIRETHERRLWCIKRQVNAHLMAGRGRSTQLANELGVTRQTISRWLTAKGWEHQEMPGWAGAAILVWWLNRSGVPILKENFKAWHGRIVTPQADNPAVVTPQSDNGTKGATDGDSKTP